MEEEKMNVEGLRTSVNNLLGLLSSKWGRSVAVLALCFLLAALLPRPFGVAAEEGDGASDTTTTAPDQSPQQIDPELEQLVDDQATLLGSRWAGTSWNTDGSVTFAITEGPVPPELANHPKVQVVTKRFSSSRLDAAMETVTSRLNPLLAPGRTGGDGAWPYHAQVKDQANVVEVQVDRRYEDKRQDIEEALADELDAGTVRIIFGEVGESRNLACSSRSNCYHPFRGGTASNSCTLGFVMRTANGVRQSSAGHCGDQKWSNAGRAIGPTIWIRE